MHTHMRTHVVAITRARAARATKKTIHSSKRKHSHKTDNKVIAHAPLAN